MPLSNPPAADIQPYEFVFDGGGSAITTGKKGHIHILQAGTLQAWTLTADDQAGAIKIDVWRCTYAAYDISTHPVDADSICNGHEPGIPATNAKATDTDLSDWTSVALAAGDVLAFNVDSCESIQRATLALKVLV